MIISAMRQFRTKNQLSIRNEAETLAALKKAIGTAAGIRGMRFRGKAPGQDALVNAAFLFLASLSEERMGELLEPAMRRFEEIMASGRGDENESDEALGRQEMTGVILPTDDEGKAERRRSR